MYRLDLEQSMANKYLAKYKRKQPLIMDISPDDELEMDFISGEVQDIKGEQAISDDLQLSKAEKQALQKDINNRIAMLQKRAKKIHCPARKRKVLKQIKSLKQGSAAVSGQVISSTASIATLLGLTYYFRVVKEKSWLKTVLYAGVVNAIPTTIFNKIGDDT
jgi:hypothetical protein